MCKDLIIELLSQDGYYTLNKRLVKLIGLENAFLLSCFIDKYKFFNEEFFYTKENILNDTRLTEYSLNASLKFLRDNNLITIIKKGCPAKNYYNINFDKIQNLLENDTTRQTENDTTGQSENNTTSSFQIITTSDIENNITSDCEINTTSNSENTTTYNKNKISKNKEIKTNNKENILKESLIENEKNQKNEIQIANQTQIQKQTQTKIQLLKNDPNFKYFLEIANRIKQLVETQKRINITNIQVANWATEVNKLYKTLEVVRGNEEAIGSMFLMINTLNADVNYQDKYKPVIESGKSFREKFIKIEDYYKRRQTQMKNQQEYDNGDDIIL